MKSKWVKVYFEIDEDSTVFDDWIIHQDFGSKTSFVIRDEIKKHIEGNYGVWIDKDELKFLGSIGRFLAIKNCYPATNFDLWFKDGEDATFFNEWIEKVFATNEVELNHVIDYFIDTYAKKGVVKGNNFYSSLKGYIKCLFGRKTGNVIFGDNTDVIKFNNWKRWKKVNHV